MLKSSRGQSTLEYSILAVIIIAALVSTQVYMKRGIQGRWKDSVDQLGDQYSPGLMCGVVTHRTLSTSESRVRAVVDNRVGRSGYMTLRSDNSSTRETKDGTMEIRY